MPSYYGRMLELLLNAHIFTAHSGSSETHASNFTIKNHFIHCSSLLDLSITSNKPSDDNGLSSANK